MAGQGWFKGAFTAVGDVAAAILGGVLGAKWSEKATGKEKAQAILEKGAEIVVPHLQPDREDVLKELDRLGLREILNLIEKTNLAGGIIRIRNTSGKVVERKAENWLINMLLKVEPRDRGAVFAKLNALLEDEGVAALIARLQVLDNDWYSQYPRMFAEAFADKASDAWQRVPSLDGALANAEPRLKKVEQWLNRKGVR